MVLSIKKSGRLTYLYVLKAYRDDTDKSTIVYDDCTNYFFESEEEKGLKQYGVSKENRPNPIVQMGMFMDMEGMPIDLHAHRPHQCFPRIRRLQNRHTNSFQKGDAQNYLIY